MTVFLQSGARDVRGVRDREGAGTSEQLPSWASGFRFSRAPVALPHGVQENDLPSGFARAALELVPGRHNENLRLDAWCRKERPSATSPDCLGTCRAIQSAGTKGDDAPATGVPQLRPRPMMVRALCLPPTCGPVNTGGGVPVSRTKGYRSPDIRTSDFEGASSDASEPGTSTGDLLKTLPQRGAHSSASRAPFP